MANKNRLSKDGKGPVSKAKGIAQNRGQKKGQGALRAGSAFKKSAASNKVGRPDANADKKGFSHLRSKGTINRINLYKDKPNRHKMQEEAMGPARIQPDRRWFGNTRVMAQDKMQKFRETLSKSVEDPFSVVLKSSRLPMSLLKDTEGKSSRMNLLSVEPFKDVFGKKGKRKRVKLGSYDLEGMLAATDKKQDEYSDVKDKRALVDASGLDKEDDMIASATHHPEEIFLKGTSKRIWAELYKVVDSSDVLVFVLDARDPQGTRCPQLERELKKNHPHKHIVFLLNKVDLVPTWVTRRWVEVLTKEFPTLAFHASVTNPFGKSALLNLLRQFGCLLKQRKHVTIGMVGYPNVGKSAVINTLKKKKVCKSACVPGETKVWQYIALTKRIYLLDCPGIVPSSEGDVKSDTAKVLKGVVRAERINSPSDYIDEVVQRVKRAYLIKKYKLSPDATWKNAEDFLTILGKKMGKLVKGGDADLDTTARIVLYDWQRGKIPFFVTPPDREGHEETAASSGGAASSSSAPKALKGDSGSSAAALEDGAADEQNDGDDELAAAGTVAVHQAFDELACTMEFDEDDRRGEALATNNDDDDDDDDDGEGGQEARGQKRKADPAAGKAKKKNRRGGGGGGGKTNQDRDNRSVGPASGAGGDRPQGGASGRAPVVDWAKVNAEFGM